MSKEKIVYFYTISLLLALFLFYSGVEKKAKAYFENKKIPAPVILFKDNNKKVELKVINRKKHLTLQFINFSERRLDTVVLSSNVINNTSGENSWIMNRPSSPKWRPPVGKFKHSMVMGFRFIDPSNDEAGKWSYFTRIKPHNFEVVSLIMDPASLYDFNKGLYTAGASQLNELSRSKEGNGWWLNAANWNNRGKEWERFIVFQLLDKEGNILFSKDAKMRIHGNATRGFPQKSFRVSPMKTKKNKFFEFPFFDENKYTKYSALLLRNSGNDWGRTMFADAFIQSQLRPEIIDRQSHKPVIIYINGVYWGIYDLSEKLDEKYIAKKYHVDKKNITVLEGEQLEYGSKKEHQGYLKLLELCSKNPDDPKTYSTLCHEIDVQNFAMYVAIQFYIVNTDWPNLNVKLYRISGQKWKWLIRDLDCSYSFSGHEAYSKDMFTYLKKFNGAMGKLFSCCMKHKEFRKIFRNTLNELMDTDFNIAKQLKCLDEYKKNYGHEIEMHSKRWRKPVSIRDWENNIHHFKVFIKKRESVIKSQIKKHLPVEGIPV